MEGLLSLQEAVRRCTGLVADTFRLKGRGYIREGCFADLVIFDPSSIIDRADYVNPFQSPTGIEMVIVNGEVVAEGGEHTGRLPGQFIS
jgi:N-acyl-D-aspartate/D-glutamate deacylase